MSKPPPTRRRFEKLEIERRLDNAAQRTRLVLAEGRVSWVSEVTFPFRSMPSAVLVTARLAYGCKVSPGLHVIPAGEKSRNQIRARRGGVSFIQVLLISPQACLGDDDFVNRLDFWTCSLMPPSLLELRFN